MKRCCDATPANGQVAGDPPYLERESASGPNGTAPWRGKGVRTLRGDTTLGEGAIHFAGFAKSPHPRPLAPGVPGERGDLFLRLALENNTLAAATPERGRFRAFLLTVAKNIL